MFNQNKILKISSKANYWLVRAGNKAEFYDDFQYNNFIAVGNNEILLSDLQEIDSYSRISDDILEQQYKSIFFESFFSEYNKDESNKNKDKATRQADLTSLRRSSGIAASKVFNFVEKMSIGDFIMLPNQGSTKFLLGFILSDAFDDEINHVKQEIILDDMSDTGYSISNFEKKRRVFWIKEFNNKDLPDKLSWIRQTRQTIYDLTSYAEQINPLISANYIYKGDFYSRIGITTVKPVSSLDLFQFQKLIIDIAGDKSNKIHQKISIQSPGFSLLHTALENWESIGIILASLFGHVTFKKGGWSCEIKGVIPYFFSKTEKYLQQEKLRKEKLENDLKEVEVQKEKIELKTLELNYKVESENISKKLKLTNSEVGNEVPIEMQMDNLSEPEVLFEKEETPKRE